MNPYGTHQPILLALQSSRTLTHILELGTGECSTPFFLDRYFFPGLEKLVSLEHDEAYRSQAWQRWGDDPRFILNSQPNLARAVGLMDLSIYDVVLVDNGSAGDMVARIEAIEAVLRHLHPCVVIHDIEVPEYRAAAEETNLSLAIFDHVKPWTGLVYDPEQMDEQEILKLRKDLQSVSS